MENYLSIIFFKQPFLFKKCFTIFFTFYFSLLLCLKINLHQKIILYSTKSAKFSTMVNTSFVVWVTASVNLLQWHVGENLGKKMKVILVVSNIYVADKWVLILAKAFFFFFKHQRLNMNLIAKYRKRPKYFIKILEYI